jgi:hypothetical protein
VRVMMTSRQNTNARLRINPPHPVWDLRVDDPRIAAAYTTKDYP